MSAERTSQVMDLIDGALDDWETSPDAMRWRPPESEPIAPRNRLAYAPGYVIGVPGELRSTLALNAVGGLGEAMMLAIEDEMRNVVQQIASLSNSPAGQVIRDLRIWQDAVDAEPTPDADPRERALRMRRNRNTGPALDRKWGRR